MPYVVCTILEFQISPVCQCHLANQYVHKCSTSACMPMSFSYNTSSTNTSIGTVLDVSCLTDKVFDDNSNRKNLTTTCMADGQWDPPIPNCKGILFTVRLIRLPVLLEEHASYALVLAGATLVANHFSFVWRAWNSCNETCVQ